MSDLQDVHAQLRNAILRGDFAPRQRLIEAELAERYGAGRFVIRNALLQLAADGLVELQPNRGARVREISVDEAVEITEIRRAVEGLVAARAAEQVTDAQIEELHALGESMTLAVEQGELLRYSDLNATLHSQLREIAGHATATRIIEQLNGQMVRHQFRLSLVPGRPSVSLPEHLAIIDAVCDRDSERAGRLMGEHIGSVIVTLRTLDDQARSMPQVR
ncbi:GntR family transcriptional regulator [Agromyces sp. Soil535]|uniref:GntR family transcriptional regulator n=1 Tax=Agromyces sp. Soil535 TaxID=1736390 RepID=UPI000B256E94|nr:GntR family transcriptional regulator [Agromyces sp. Soil535]